MTEHVTPSTPVDAPQRVATDWTVCAVCGATRDVRPFLCGPRCPTDAPGAVRATNEEGTNQ